MNRRTVGIIAVVVFGGMMPIRFYLQEQERKEREQMLYELSQQSSKWMQAAGDSMMKEANRQQMKMLEASTVKLNEIGRSLDSLRATMPMLDTTSRLTDMPEVNASPLTDIDTDDPLGVKDNRAKIAENPTPELYLDTGISEEIYENYDQAKKDYRAALDLDPSYGPAMFQLARLHLKLGEVDQAEKLADECEKHERAYANSIRKDIKAYRQKNP